MYLYQQKKPNGDVYLAIKEKYHVRGKGACERTVERIGYLSEFRDKYPDPIAHFREHAAELSKEKAQEKNRTVQIDMNSVLEPGTNDTRNAGYGVLREIYRQLEIGKFWNWKTRGRKMDFSMEQLFRLLVFSRALQPGSKRFTLNNRDMFFEPFDDISLDDMYHALDVIADNQEDLQKWIFDHSQKIVGERSLSTSYFDCTNYYFDISHPDADLLDGNGMPVDENGNPAAAKYRKRGPEKNHRPDPIVEMGLLMDSRGIPVSYDLFPGNESEKVHMRPILNRVKNQFSDARIIVVADRGLNTSDNIYWLNGDNKSDHNQRDGYVYGQSVRGADAEFKEWVLRQNYRTDKVMDNNGNEVLFIHKSRIYPKKLQVNVTRPGSSRPAKRSVSVDQKQMAYYSEKYARRQRMERELMVARARDLILHPKKYDRITAKGSSSYIRNIAFDKDTGAIVNGRNLELDEEKIAEEAKYDGYYSIVTSELNLSDTEIRNIYRGLARIEDSFKVTKTFFRSRPVYVWTNEHIEAHFATCFTALVLIRLLEAVLGNQYPAGQILNSLKKYNCTQIGSNVWQFTYFDDILRECGEKLDMKLNVKYRSRQEIQRLLHY